MFVNSTETDWQFLDIYSVTAPSSISIQLFPSLGKSSFLRCSSHSSVGAPWPGECPIHHHPHSVFPGLTSTSLWHDMVVISNSCCTILLIFTHLKLEKSKKNSQINCSKCLYVYTNNLGSIPHT